MEDRIISETRRDKAVHEATAVQSQTNYFDQDLEDCLTILLDNNSQLHQFQPDAPSVPISTPSSSCFIDSTRTPPPQQPPVAWEQPCTPTQQKVQKLLCSARYRHHEKAGELAIQMAVLLIREEVLKISGLGSHHGKLRPLDERKMDEIEDMIKRHYRGQGGDTDKVWKKCRVAIAKKCQRLRAKSQTASHFT